MAIAPPLTPADLATVTAFAGLPDATLEWLLAHGASRHLAPGEILFEPGAPAELMTAIIRGGIQFYAVKGAQREPIFRAEAGQVTGVLPYSRLRVIAGQGVAVGDTLLYTLHRDQFPALEQASPELTQRLVAVMNDRSRE
jgi:CRP-like cAMP-binding protein